MRPQRAPRRWYLLGLLMGVLATATGFLPVLEHTPVVDGLDGARSVALTPNEAYVDDSLAVFRRDATTGALTFDEPPPGEALSQAVFEGGDGDGYTSATQVVSFPAFVNLYPGGDGDGYHSATQVLSFPAFVNLYPGGDGDGYTNATQVLSFPAFVNLYPGGDGDGYDSSLLTVSFPGETMRYVAMTGTDASNDCTNPANPCATITHTIAQANPGETLNLATGTYNEPGLVIDKALHIVGAGVIVQ